MYPATAGLESVEAWAGQRLDDLLSDLARCFDPGLREDVPVWYRGRLVAVLMDRGGWFEVVRLL